MNYGNYNSYNNGATADILNQYKTPYQTMPFAQQMQQPPVMYSVPQNIPTVPNDMLWVLGEVEATSYPVAPNNTVILWDKNQPTIYIKSANAQGVPSMRILDFTERAANSPKTSEQHVCKCGENFTPKSDFKALEGKFEDVLCRLSDIEEKYNALATKSTVKTSKRTEEE